MPNLPEPILDFTVVLDKLIAELRAGAVEPDAVSISARRREQLRRALEQRSETEEPLVEYRGLPITTAIEAQISVAVISGGRAYLV